MLFSENARVSPSSRCAAAPCSVPGRSCSPCMLSFTPKCVCDMQTCLLPCLLLTWVHTAQGLLGYSRSTPEESKAERLVSILPTGHPKQCLQTISEAFHVLTGGLGRVQTPKQTMAAQNGLEGWQFPLGKLWFSLPQNGAMTEAFPPYLWGCKYGAFAPVKPSAIQKTPSAAFISLFVRQTEVMS